VDRRQSQRWDRLRSSTDLNRTRLAQLARPCTSGTMSIVFSVHFEFKSLLDWKWAFKFECGTY